MCQATVCQTPNTLIGRSCGVNSGSTTCGGDPYISCVDSTCRRKSLSPPTKNEYLGLAVIIIASIYSAYTGIQSTALPMALMFIWFRFSPWEAITAAHSITLAGSLTKLGFGLGKTWVDGLEVKRPVVNLNLVVVCLPPLMVGGIGGAYLAAVSSELLFSVFFVVGSMYCVYRSMVIGYVYSKGGPEKAKKSGDETNRTGRNSSNVGLERHGAVGNNSPQADSGQVEESGVALARRRLGLSRFGGTGRSIEEEKSDLMFRSAVFYNNNNSSSNENSKVLMRSIDEEAQIPSPSKKKQTLVEIIPPDKIAIKIKSPKKKQKNTKNCHTETTSLKRDQHLFNKKTAGRSSGQTQGPKFRSQTAGWTEKGANSLKRSQEIGLIRKRDGSILQGYKLTLITLGISFSAFLVIFRAGALSIISIKVPRCGEVDISALIGFLLVLIFIWLAGLKNISNELNQKVRLNWNFETSKETRMSPCFAVLRSIESILVGTFSAGSGLSNQNLSLLAVIDKQIEPSETIYTSSALGAVGSLLSLMVMALNGNLRLDYCLAFSLISLAANLIAQMNSGRVPYSLKVKGTYYKRMGIILIINGLLTILAVVIVLEAFYEVDTAELSRKEFLGPNRWCSLTSQT